MDPLIRGWLAVPTMICVMLPYPAARRLRNQHHWPSLVLTLAYPYRRHIFPGLVCQNTPLLEILDGSQPSLLRRDRATI